MTVLLIRFFGQNHRIRTIPISNLFSKVNSSNNSKVIIIYSFCTICCCCFPTSDFFKFFSRNWNVTKKEYEFRVSCKCKFNCCLRKHRIALNMNWPVEEWQGNMCASVLYWNKNRFNAKKFHNFVFWKKGSAKSHPFELSWREEVKWCYSTQKSNSIVNI